MSANLETPSSDDDALLLDAYADGELDASAALAVERRIESDPAAKVELERLMALRSVLRAKVPREVASDALRNRLSALSMPGPVSQRPTARPISRDFDWRRMAATVIVAAGLGSAGTAVLLRQDTGTAGISSIVAEHRRALLSANPLDVESTDKHTVKPWFDAKLALSPQVIDLAADGYPLAGGRVEVVGGKLVPAMLYRRRAHVISLVAVPRAGGRDDGAAASSTTEDGYMVASWHGQDFDYSAVSDIAPEELTAFVAGWRAAAK